MNILNKAAGWLAGTIKKPTVIAVLFAGVLIAFGVPEPLAKQLGSAAGAVATAVEQGGQVQPATDGKAIINLEPGENP